MKSLIAIVMLVGGASVLAAEPVVNVTKAQLGNAGDPAQTVTVGSEPALPVGDGMYFVPQYMPSYPTAASIWARVVKIDCVKSEDGSLKCDGFHWKPELGRGEYLFVIPNVKETPAPIVVVKEVEVLVEVPVQKVGE